MSETATKPAPARPSLSARRTRRLWRAAFFGLAMAGIIAGVAWALLGSRLLVVRSVVVTGTHLVPSSSVLAVAGVQPGSPMVRVNAAQVVSRVEAIRQVQSAQVVKSWPDRVVIEVRERISAVAVAVPGGYDLVDASGVVVRSSVTRPQRLPLYVSGATVAALRGDPSVGLAAAVLAELPAAVRSSVMSVSVPDGRVTLVLADGVTVVWGDTSAPGPKAQVLAILMRTGARYYDVSAPGMAMTRG